LASPVAIDLFDELVPKLNPVGLAELLVVVEPVPKLNPVGLVLVLLAEEAGLVPKDNPDEVGTVVLVVLVPNENPGVEVDVLLVLTAVAGFDPNVNPVVVAGLVAPVLELDVPNENPAKGLVVDD